MHPMYLRSAGWKYHEKKGKNIISNNLKAYTVGKEGSYLGSQNILSRNDFAKKKTLRSGC